MKERACWTAEVYIHGDGGNGEAKKEQGYMMWETVEDHTVYDDVRLNGSGERVVGVRGVKMWQ